MSLDWSTNGLRTPIQLLAAISAIASVSDTDHHGRMGRIALLTAGVWLGVEQRELLPLTLLLLILVGLALLWSFFRSPVLNACSCLIVGFLWLSVHGHWQLYDRLPASFHLSELVCEGRLMHPAEIKLTRWQFDLHLQRCLVEGQWQAHSLRIRTSWYRPAIEQPPQGGETWRFLLKLRQPRGSMNPQGFDYETWMFQRGLHASAYVRDPAQAIRLSPAPWWSLARWREHIGARLRSVLPDDPVAGVIPALVLADRSGISPPLWQRFREAGTGHLLAISGLHVGLLAAFGALMGGFAWRILGVQFARRSIWVGCSSLIAATAYAALAGFSLPTTRALLMLTVVVFSVLQGRHRVASDTLGLAFLAVLVIDPLSVLSAGFWLSFGSVACIVVGLNTKRHWNRWQQMLWVNAAMGLVLAPLSHLLFGQMAWWSSAANLLLVPVFSLCVVPMSLFGTALAILGLPGAGSLLQWSTAVIAWCDNWQALLLKLPVPELALFGWAPLGLVIMSAALLAPRLWRGSAALLVAAIVLLTSPKPSQLARGGFVVTTLDVGHGLAVLVETQHHVLIYDTGSARTGSRALLPALRGGGWSAPDKVLISHDDQDHRGGLAALQRQFAGFELLTSSNQDCDASRSWQWDGVHFELLHPVQQWADDNNSSCVLRVSSAFGSALLPGDIEREAESAMLSRGAVQPSDLLLVPHHGSKTSSSAAWLAKVRPKIAVVSVARDSRWGMPHQPVLDRLAGLSTQVLSTGDHGAITARFDSLEGGPQVAFAREDRRRFWHLP